MVERKSAQPAYAFRLHYIFFGKRSRSSQDETRIVQWSPWTYFAGKKRDTLDKPILCDNGNQEKQVLIGDTWTDRFPLSEIDQLLVLFPINNMCDSMMHPLADIWFLNQTEMVDQTLTASCSANIWGVSCTGMHAAWTYQMAPEKRKCLTEGTKTTPAMSQAKKALNEGHGLVLTQLDVTQETCRTSRREFAGSDSELFPAYHMSPSPWNPMASRALATHAWSNCFAICRTCRAVAIFSAFLLYSLRLKTNTILSPCLDA